MKISWIKKSVCALLLSLNQIAFNIGNETRAIFVNNKSTSSYCPYRQADRLIDGLLWHYDPKNKKAFFILGRVFENNQFKFISNSKYLGELKKNHFKEIDVDELEKNSKNGDFYKYLYDSFITALHTNGRTSIKEQHPNIVDSDFPLNNLAEYFDGCVNGDDYFFWQRIFLQTGEKGPVQLLSNVYSSWNDSSCIFGANSFLKEVPTDKLESAVSEISKSLVLSHGTPTTRKELDGHLSSVKTLKWIGMRYGNHTCMEDVRLNNKGFVFTMLCNEKSKKDVGGYVIPRKTNLFFKNLEKLPIVVCSKDQIHACLYPDDYSHPEYDDNNNLCPGDVYVCSGKDLSSIMARHYFSSKRGKKYVDGSNNDFKKGYDLWSSKKRCYGSAKYWPCECRIPTYLILSDENFYKFSEEEIADYYKP